MTGVTRRFLTGAEGEPAGNDTTLSATQVGPRRVEACLGGQDDGALGSTWGRKRIDPSMITGMAGNVGSSNIQRFYKSWK